jgi:hypothetical protein
VLSYKSQYLKGNAIIISSSKDFPLTWLFMPLYAITTI